jgi:hypothetical protein
LQNARAAGDAAISIVKDDFARFAVGRPATDRAHFVALPYASAFIAVVADLQPSLNNHGLYLFLQHLAPIHFGSSLNHWFFDTKNF